MRFQQTSREQMGPICQGEHNDCTVRAFSVAADIPYSEAHTIFKAAGRKDRKGTSITFMADLCRDKSYGRFNATRVDMKFQRVSLAQFCRDFKKGNFMVVKHGHAFAVKDGVVFDNFEVGARSQIKAVFYFEPKAAI
jgi:hypothetical protein